MSILAVDFGSIHTRAVLIDQVDGVYQLVARAQTRSTDSFPVNDLLVGLERATRDLSASTGRNFTGESGRLIIPERGDRSGVDVFVATASTGRPMRTVIVDLVPDFSGASARRAASGTYADIVAEVNLMDGRDAQERMNIILLSAPDVILIAGGTDAGANDSLMGLIDVVRLALLVTPADQRPVVLYAGNQKLADRVRAEFEGISDILVSQNVRPEFAYESLKDAQYQLAEAYERYKQARSEAFARIAEISAAGVIPTAQSYTTVIDYLSRQARHGILSVDMGSASSVLTLAVGGGQVTTAIRTDLGVGHNAISLLDTAGVDAVRQWLPFNISRQELYNYAANKSLRPTTVPVTLRDTYIEHALLRAGARAMLNAARPPSDTRPPIYDVLIAAGATLTGVGNPAYTALLLLDIVQPEGVSHLMSDPFGLLPALGAVAMVQPAAVVQTLDNNNLEPIGYSFCVSGKPALDKPALKVKITLSSGEVIQETVPGGYVWVYKLPLNQTAQVVVTTARRGLQIGGKRKIKVKVSGGTAGLIFDARGRALSTGANVQQRAVFLPLWIAQATDLDAHEIDPAWLEPLPDDDDIEAELLGLAPPPSIKEAKPARRGRFAQKAVSEKGKPESAPDDDDNDDQNVIDDPLKELRDATLS